MSLTKKIFLIIAVVVTIGGAINSGMTTFFMAVPFMGYLLYQSYKEGKLYFMACVIFIVICIITSKTRDSNPLLYPIIRNGTATVLQDGYQRTFSIDGSGSFQTSSTTTISCAGCGGDKVTPLKKGEVYKVLGVHHGPDGFRDEVGVITEVGRFSSSDVNYNRYIGLNKPIQSTWSKYLGNLMYWPIFPFVAITTFNK